jgi:hypothetical protein|tara:strand:- start:2965 stop:3414 length:450 start_codon:yes stop_codon:yes gene_type:complete
MADSIQQAKIDSTPSQKVKANELAGRVRVAFAEYEASAEQSTIHMFSIPNGARLLSGSVAYDALGSSTTISVGYAAHTKADGTTEAADVDQYKAAAASTSAQSVAVLDTIALDKNAVTDADKDGVPVTVTLAGANGTGTIQLQMLYVID